MVKINCGLDAFAIEHFLSVTECNQLRASSAEKDFQMAMMNTHI